MTRTKRLAGEPLLSLSSTKQPKRRKIVKNVNSVENVISTTEIEEARHVCSPRCSALSSTCPVTEPEVENEEQSEDDDILNTSDQNENDLQDISAEIESLDGGLDMEFEELDMDEETDDVRDKPEKKKRGKNIGYILIERFENKSEFDKFWAENEFSDLYNHHLERTCKVGSEDTFRCKFYSKSGFSKCKMQAKVIFPGCDDSAELFLTDDSHQH